MTNKNDILFNAAKKLNDRVIKEKETLPFSINLINELHINENAHSRILNMLLQYCNNGQYTLLNSFISLINRQIDDNMNVAIGRPQFSCERDRIDVLVCEYGKYALIIENKIYGAADQSQQIERYIEAVLNKGVPEENIYVLYLTKDGRKEASNISLT